MANGTVKVSQVDVLTTSGTGTISIVPPATNTNRTLTLPDQTATVATLTTPSFGTTIGVGGATASSSGAGVSFPATQSASTDANTLDDYEEGTWTPVYTGSTGSIGSTAYSSQTGRYTRVGRMIFATCECSLSNKGSWTGTVYIGGLPYNISGASEICMGSVILDAVDITGSLYANVRGTGSNSDTKVRIGTTNNNAASGALQTTGVGNTSQFFLNIIYTAS